VAGGRGRGGIHRRGWFHRHQPHRSPTHTSETAGAAPADFGEEAFDAADETTPASFDQVLRQAAEAREADREPDD
jgi:hypothetical protein